MSHLDDELIAAAAIGERLADGDAGHLDACTHCLGEVRELEALMSRATATGAQAPLLAPPARVWDAIVSEIAFDDVTASLREGEAAAVDAPDARDDGLATVTPIGAAVRPLRPSSIWRLVATAAAGVVIGGVGVGMWANGGGGDVTVVASAPLTSLVTDAPAGTARVEDRPGGARVLVIDTDFTAPDDADLEVWLIDPNVEGMVSLGYLDSSRGEFTIPAGYEPSAYPIVDISVEPRDGVPTHSSDSITRGILTS